MRMIRRTTHFALVALALAVSCRSVPSGQSPDHSQSIGASSSRAAVEMYMEAMRKGDFALIGNIWGSHEGLARDRYSREEFEKRAFVVSCYLGWAGYRIDADRPAVDNGRTVVVQSTPPGQHQEATLRIEQDSAGRWFVAGAELAGLSPDRCTKGSS